MHACMYKSVYVCVCVLALTVSEVIPVVFGKLGLAESLWTNSFCPTAPMTCMGIRVCVCKCETKTHFFPKCVWILSTVLSQNPVLHPRWPGNTADVSVTGWHQGNSSATRPITVIRYCLLLLYFCWSTFIDFFSKGDIFYLNVFCWYWVK